MRQERRRALQGGRFRRPSQSSPSLHRLNIVQEGKGAFLSICTNMLPPPLPPARLPLPCPRACAPRAQDRQGAELHPHRGLWRPLGLALVRAAPGGHPAGPLDAASGCDACDGPCPCQTACGLLTDAAWIWPLAASPTELPSPQGSLVQTRALRMQSPHGNGGSELCQGRGVKCHGFAASLSG